MYLVILILPLLGSIASGFFGRKIGIKGAQIITSSCIIITTIICIMIFIETGYNNIPVSIKLFRWIDSESINILWYFNFDALTVSMLIPVLIVSSLVHIYSIGYMSNDPHIQRFFSYLSLFTFMMIILVTANNFLLMFVGWEGVGVCSYLLVSFWFTRIAANQSSLSAFLTNRIGDCFLTIGMFVILWSFGNIDYSTVFSLSPYINENIITIIGICLLIGAMAKSSQVGLHIWLPQAMEGPTPVSALIHAATMVTAGVYLLMRASPLIEYSSTILISCLWLGAVTTIFSSIIGLFQQDIKKVIAYSTMSQLGMMVIAVGLSSYNIALFHLINHAFYKGLLFLGAGAIIHAVADNQDFRKYGGLKSFLPLTYSVMLIASLSLMAFPFMSGFFSKDLILESCYGQFSVSSITTYTIATIGAIFTTLYSVKVLYLTFLTNPNGPLINYKQAHEGDIFMNLPLIILSLFSIFFGFLSKDIFIGLGSNFFADNSIFIHPIHEIMIDTEFAVNSFYKLLPLLFTIGITIISVLMSEYTQQSFLVFIYSKIGYNIYSFFNQRSLIEFFYNKYIVNVILKLGGQTTKIIDKGSIELLGPYGLEKGLLLLSKKITNLDNGVITSYALYILIGFISYILLSYCSLNSESILVLIIFGLSTFLIKPIKNLTNNSNKFINTKNINNTNKNITITQSGIGNGFTTVIIGCIIFIIPTTITAKTIKTIGIGLVGISSAKAASLATNAALIAATAAAAAAAASNVTVFPVQDVVDNSADITAYFAARLNNTVSGAPSDLTADLSARMIANVPYLDNRLASLETIITNNLIEIDVSINKLQPLIENYISYINQHNLVVNSNMANTLFIDFPVEMINEEEVAMARNLVTTYDNLIRRLCDDIELLVQSNNSLEELARELNPNYEFRTLPFHRKFLFVTRKFLHWLN